MKAPPSPPRLRDSEEFGAELRHLDGESLSEERLARNAAMLEQRVAGIVAAAGVAGAAGAAAAAGKTAILLKIGLPAVVAVAAAGTTYVALRSPEPVEPEHRAAVQPARTPQRRVHQPVTLPPDASVPAPDGAPTADVATVAASPARPGRPARRRAAPAPQEPAAPAKSPSAPPPAPATPVSPGSPTAPAPRPAPAPGPAPAPRPAPAPGPAPAPRPAPAPGPAPSQLPEQIRLFEAAKRAARASRYDKALGLIEALLRRFPTTPLAAEARLSQAELLMRAGRLAAATTAVRGLLADPRHAGRRGELLRVLGDLLRRQGDCRGATVAYRQALAGPLTRSDAKAARGGLRACSKKRKPSPKKK